MSRPGGASPESIGGDNFYPESIEYATRTEWALGPCRREGRNQWRLVKRREPVSVS
jgi:hypothetical protein